MPARTQPACRESTPSAHVSPFLSVGSLALGTWQGIYLNEHRNYGGPRSIVVTIQGQPAAKPYGRSIAGR